MATDLSHLRVMVVDDNPHMRSIMIMLLEGLGIRNIVQFEDGATAFEGLRKVEPDVAFVDFRMATMDGVEFTRQVRTSAASPNVYLPIIMLTGHSERSRVFEARDAGVNEFIVKPVTALAVAGRLNAIAFKPRPFVRTESYMGPCRRRRDDPSYKGPWRRAGDQSAITAR